MMAEYQADTAQDQAVIDRLTATNQKLAEALTAVIDQGIDQDRWRKARAAIDHHHSLALVDGECSCL